MSTPLLATKLYIPSPRPNVVLRSRLIERLNAGLHGKLTLISAPAGFGKTSLVSAWVAKLRIENEALSKADRNDDSQYSILNSQFRVAWLSLDEGDSDPTRFLTYLVAALQTIAPTIGAGILRVLQSSQPPPPEALLTTLLNDITTLTDPFVLVLDDYHLVDAQPIDTALAFLLAHLPPQMHLVVTTREDPQLPLAQFRVRNQMTELRAADLRFTPAEAAAFLTEVMGLNLAAADIAVLEARTEGWIAGLQLAALSLQSHQNVPAFIQAFAGDNRYIVDYLAEEVLQRLPASVRSFLLQTAILDRLSGSLCDAVLDQGRRTKDTRSAACVPRPSSLILEELERGNFFVVPLDDTRHWYRYHHLFADVLTTHLRAEQPDLVPTLHRRASTWYEQHGSTADAIHHALLAEDFARAANLVELAWTAMRRSRQDATFLGWLKALPDAVLQCRPVLGVAYALVVLASGELEGVEERLRAAEQWLEKMAAVRELSSAPAAEMVVADDEAFRRLPGTIAIARAGLALARGDVPATITYARRALDVAPEDDHLTRGGAAGFLGLAFWTSGDLAAAHRTYTQGMGHLQRAGNIADAINGALTLAAIQITQGRLREAMRTYARGLQLATVPGAPLLRGAADMHVGMSELAYERDDLHAATQHLLRSQELGEHTGFPQNRYRWRVAMARIQAAQGDLDGALELLDQAERLYMSDFSPNVRPIAALKTRVWLAQGRLGEALDWAREQGLSAQDELSYGHEFEHLTLARLRLTQSTSDRADRSLHAAIGLLERLLHAAEAGERTGSVIEILVLLSLAHQIQADIPAALVPLERALILAEPEGYGRIFVDQGRPMAVLLEAAAKHGTAPTYVRQLLTALGTAEDRTPVKQGMIEPLSERERDVLRLLRTDLSGPEIARELMVSLSTMRTHTNNIYTKLGVTNRRAAVRRAEELDLF
ncbi:MAG: LuxR C-terminal-related transcriptional regulator [Roseiflexaceae bacterium]